MALQSRTLDNATRGRRFIRPEHYAIYSSPIQHMLDIRHGRDPVETYSRHLGDMREIAKVPFLVTPADPQRSNPGDIRYVLSDDRSIYVYCYEPNLVCRQTKDLKVLWTREIEPPNVVFKIASPNKSCVAVAVADNPHTDMQKEHYVLVYSGKTGAKIARLPICGTDGLALSSDGNFLAVVESKPDENKEEYLLTVKIYEVRSGRILGSVEHDRIKSQRHMATKTVCRVHFTPDGQYLISSGMNTKIWKLTNQE